jgi:hypothetical protein
MHTPMKATALAVALLLTLTGCEKPKPSVTLFSGSNSVRAEAVCWTQDGSPAIGSPGCSQDELVKTVQSGDLASLAVTPGSTFGISVDSDVADAGWYASIIVNGQAQQLVQSIMKDHYWRFTFPDSARGQFPAGGYVLQVTAAGATSGSERGIWFFTLTDADAA